MQKSQLKTPLVQSAAIIAAVVLVVLSLGFGGGILGFFKGIGYTILFVLGMAISLAVSIAVLVGIFLAAVAMVDKDKAVSMFAILKKNFSESLALLSKRYNDSATGEDYEEMKKEIAVLTKANAVLQADIETVSSKNQSLAKEMAEMVTENTAMKSQLDELHNQVEQLQISEQEIKDVVEKLVAEAKSSTNEEVKTQLAKLEKLQESTATELQAIIKRIEAIEKEASPTAQLEQVLPQQSGIFAYIDSEQEQRLFIEQVKAAVAKELTYAQIDDFLTKNLSKALDEIVKDHPTLTKNYIREVREEKA